MKRRAFLLAGMGLCASGLAQPGRFNHGLLWRITKDAIAPSHVYGTIHVGDPRVQGLPGEVEAAFSRARSLMLEFVPDPYARAHQALMTKRVVYDRSLVMAFRMQRQVRRGDAFFALGALHLYGEKGVLALLEENGYSAVRVF